MHPEYAEMTTAELLYTDRVIGDALDRRDGRDAEGCRRLLRQRREVRAELERRHLGRDEG